LKRGMRVCQRGVNLEHLQRAELMETAREWQARSRALTGQAYFLNLTLMRQT
jgi:hypothetical protein